VGQKQDCLIYAESFSCPNEAADKGTDDGL